MRSALIPMHCMVRRRRALAAYRRPLQVRSTCGVPGLGAFQHSAVAVMAAPSCASLGWVGQDSSQRGACLPSPLVAAPVLSSVPKLPRPPGSILAGVWPVAGRVMPAAAQTGRLLGLRVRTKIGSFPPAHHADLLLCTATMHRDLAVSMYRRSHQNLPHTKLCPDTSISPRQPV